MTEQITRINSVTRKLVQKLGREPSNSEIASESSFSEDKVDSIQRVTKDPIALDAPINEEESGQTLLDSISDNNPNQQDYLETSELKDLGVNSVAIMSNDPSVNEEDSFENMQKIAIDMSFPFPYLFDVTQEIAKSYGAVCTPDFFGYNKDLGLQYRGRLDESRTESVQDARRDLFEAMKDIAHTGVGPEDQIPSMGCSIKWFD